MCIHISLCITGTACTCVHVNIPHCTFIYTYIQRDAHTCKKIHHRNVYVNMRCMYMCICMYKLYMQMYIYIYTCICTQSDHCLLHRFWCFLILARIPARFKWPNACGRETTRAMRYLNGLVKALNFSQKNNFGGKIRPGLRDPLLFFLFYTEMKLVAPTISGPCHVMSCMVGWLRAKKYSHVPTGQFKMHRYICLDIHVYIYMCVYIYIYIYIYTYI